MVRVALVVVLADGAGACRWRYHSRVSATVCFGGHWRRGGGYKYRAVPAHGGCMFFVLKRGRKTAVAGRCLKPPAGALNHLLCPVRLLYRSKQVTKACKEHGGFYLGSIGGPAAILAQNCIKKVRTARTFPCCLVSCMSSLACFLL